MLICETLCVEVFSFDFMILKSFPQHGRTALMFACGKGQVEIVRWLVEKGKANVDEQDQVLFSYFSLAIAWLFMSSPSLGERLLTMHKLCAAKKVT